MKRLHLDSACLLGDEQSPLHLRQQVSCGLQELFDDPPDLPTIVLT